MAAKTEVYTIGFTETTAERFFDRLLQNGVRSVVDVRLWNRSQLSGFAKSPDIAYFLEKLGGISYRAEPLLAPTEDMLAAYRAKKLNWSLYETSFMALMRGREIEKRLNPEMFANACLLCSEALPHKCHRRLALEYLSDKWSTDLSVKHL
ncbi:MAG: DUF488 family protein [Beijerinckiaceae bacterium]